MNKNEQPLPAQLDPIRSISFIWFIPILAVLIGAWMVYDNISSRGSLIVIAFETGEGIDVGKTKIRSKNVDIGIVKKLELNSPDNNVLVTARISKKNESLLVQDTQFWVVKPRVGKAGISGISTLLSGAYIELAPGFSETNQYAFKGLEDKPVTPAGTNGLNITLDSSGNTALHTGDPILYRGIDVGRIEHVHFNSQEKRVYYDAFIESPYDKLITSNTKFWSLNGFEVDLSADGLHVQTGSLESLITGGITFDVPTDMTQGKVLTSRGFFTIYPNKSAIYNSRYKHASLYTLLFNSSLRGLNLNTPVEFRGIKIGSVINTGFNHAGVNNVLDPSTLIPVTIKIEPARLGFEDNKEAIKTLDIEIKKSIQKGLQASIATGNILTGNKLIELTFSDKPRVKSSNFNGHIVIPTTDNQIDQLLEQLNNALDKLNKLPIETVLIGAEKTLSNVNSSLKDFEKLAKSFSEGSATHSDLQGLLQRMKRTLNELDPLIIQLNQKPNSLFFGGQQLEEMEPKGAK
ncbi:MAG: paraquat-inducible protein B [Piscirickettsiaceae bacterium]|nr:MAG: paraquat-inducible protein B [Piscirickettsiaceae bacterium]